MNSYLTFLKRNKLYSAIEAVGLIVSITFVILIGNYVYRQYAMAYSNPIGHRIYAVGNEDVLSLSWWDKAEFEAKLPEAEAVCRVSNADSDGYISIDGESFTATIAEYDPEMFELFPSLCLLDGSLDEFRLEGYCLISESLAKRAFKDDPIGKTFNLYFFGNEVGYVVCGIFKDEKTSMIPHTDVLINPEYDPVFDHAHQKPFSSVGSYMTLIKVRENTDREMLEQKIHDICKENYGSWIGDIFPVYSLPEVFFEEYQFMFRKSNKSLLQILSVVVILLLISAVFNYVNLNMALSGKRAKEMATRRLHGATKGRIIMKYIAESVLFTAVCVVMALLLAIALLPMMNGLLNSVSGGELGIAVPFGQFVPIELEWSAKTIIIYLAFIMLLGALVGVAPAAVASRFAPIDVVNGTYRRQRKMLFGRFFIVFQNTLTVILLALALTMEMQMRHMMNRPIHSRSEGLYSLQIWVDEYAEVEPLIDRLNNIPNVNAVGYGHGFAGQVNMGSALTTPEGEKVQIPLILCDETYFDMLGLEVVEDFGLPRTNSVWMSKSLADKVALSDSTLHYYARQLHINGTSPESVGGVYADIPTTLASESVQYSAVIIAKATDLYYGNGVMIDVAGDYKETEYAIMEAYRAYSEEQNGVMVEAALNGYVRDLQNLSLLSTKMTMRLLELFMALSVLISLLGLIAMSTYFSGENAKSIAVRKVFGSNVRRELWRTVKDYMILVGIAALIAAPITVWLCGQYLERFAYRITRFGWIVIVAVVLNILMAFLSVLWQTLKAAHTNPVIELKKE